MDNQEGKGAVCRETRGTEGEGRGFPLVFQSLIDTKKWQEGGALGNEGTFVFPYVFLQGTAVVLLLVGRWWEGGMV